MTFNDDANLRGNRVKRRGRTAAVAGGGGGLLVVGLFIVSQLLGVDITGLAPAIQGGAGGGTTQEQTLEQCQTGEDANQYVECRVAGAQLSLDDYWSGQMGGDYVEPGIVVFEQSVSTGCGNATSAVGPFYCPADQSVYLDTSFYDDLRGRFGASGGPLAEMYVVAHEWGHHISQLTGVFDRMNRQDTGPTSDAVRSELQADCFAGAWAKGAAETEDETGVPFLEPLTQQQIADALNAADAIGDDRIQEQTQGQVNPETWTHGSSDQRERWFTAGYKGGPGACDTFAVSGSQL
jgi:predicted metalloprotease